MQLDSMEELIMSEYSLLWLDLETTGSDPEKDKILEIGTVLTDYELNELDSYSAVISDQENLKLMDDYVRNMHTVNGLIKDIEAGSGTFLKDAEISIIKMMQDNGAPSKLVVLAGSGVSHFDRFFIKRYMKDLNAYLKYFNIDVGVMRRVLTIIGRDDLIMKDFAKPHRALDDARLHLEEMRYIKKVLNGEKIKANTYDSIVSGPSI